MTENKYHDLDKQITKEIMKALLADGVESYPVKCRTCNGTGVLILEGVKCPECKGEGQYDIFVDGAQ